MDSQRLGEATRKAMELGGLAPNMQLTRHARRVYVGGLPPGAGEVELASFFNQAMHTAGAIRPGAQEAVLGCYINVVSWWRMLFLCCFALVESEPGG